mmetsp:Transcript_32483/g.107040  ORF Transcript_32483/g.107040 Transcript_32483/m.107040 type:complete len:255 (+) Transcript_32483:283-1047(+)
MSPLQLIDLILQLVDVLCSSLEVTGQVLRIHDAGLLPQLTRIGPVLVALVLGFCDQVALSSQVLVQLTKFSLQFLVILLHKLNLLPHVRNDLHCRYRLLPQLVQFLVPLLNLFVERLIFDLQLLKVDHMQVVGELIFFSQRLFKFSEPVLQGYVGSSHLLHFSILVKLELFNLLYNLLWYFLSSAGILGMTSNLPLKLLKRVAALNGFLAFRLQLVFQLFAHARRLDLLQSELKPYVVNVVEHVLVLVLSHLAL